MRLLRVSLLIALASVLSGLPAPHAGDGAARAAEACFVETGFCLRGRFLAYWLTNGGLARNDYPLSEERRETLEDGRAYTVQYFERVRLEHHPENAYPDDVLLGHFGRRILAEDHVGALGETYEQAIAPVLGEGPDYFPQTGHTIAPGFRVYWERNGGLAQFGYPLTEERWDSLPTGAGACCITQYFERARFEWHPEHAGSPYVVLLGQFGRRILGDEALLTGALGRLYRADAAVRRGLGRPLGAAVPSAGATQGFEGGRMFWAEQMPSHGRAILVLCGGEAAGQVLAPAPGLFYLDSWAPGQEPGGGPAPVAGRSYPQRGFGTVWREDGRVRACLGYATSAEETAFRITVQAFAGGYLVLSDAPAARAGYVVTGSRQCTSCELRASYRRYAVPAP
jgi:hypothetical protein